MTVNYRVYKLSAAGRITSGEWIEASNDDDAMTKAHALCGPATPQVELWRGAERLAVLPCDDELPQASAGRR